MSLLDELARCEREIERCKSDSSWNDHPGGALLGLRDWFYERRLIMAEIEKGKEIDMAGGRVSSSEIPHFELIPTVALVRLAERFKLGLDRKGDKAWNALTQNQEVLTDRGFILSRIAHVIHHALKLRDKVLAGEALGDDDAGAIIWGGAFLCCAEVAKPPLNCSACGGSGHILRNDNQFADICPACHGTGKQRAK
jgi:hypothetical protein